MSTLLDCPSCARKLRVPDEFLGKSVRCPTCGETFGAPDSPPPSPPEAGNGAAAEAKEPANGSAPHPQPPSPEARGEEEAAPATNGTPLLDVPLKLELDEATSATPAAPPPAP